MSLRTEIHSAFDEVAPSTFGLPERVVQTVLTESPRRHRRERLMSRLRAPLSLVAVLVLIAVVVGVLIGGKLTLDWNASHMPAPAGGVYLSPLAQLEARPLHVSIPKSLADCRSGPFNKAGDFGSGPVYGAGGPQSRTSWGIYYHNLLYTDVNVNGPVLVRAVDLFTGMPVIFVGQYATGPPARTDTIDGAPVHQYTELLIDTSRSTPDLLPWWSNTHDHKYEWGIAAGVPQNWSNSTGWQMDAPGFSEVFYAC
ncbi:MAG: hypothetical protein ABI334_03180 [Candidatus Dormiibacterota bacterium]